MPMINSMVLARETTPDGIEHRIIMRGAYDFRDPRPNQNFGIHNAELDFVVSRNHAAVNWHFSTGWWPAKLRKEIPSLDQNNHNGLGGIEIHSPIPLYEGQTPVADCDYTGGDCYCDGSALASRKLFELAVLDPGVIWPHLEARLLKLEQQIAVETSENAKFT